MKTITKVLFGIMSFVPFTSLAFYAHVYGPNYTCPNSQLNYTYDDDYGGGVVTFTITNGQILNEINQTWGSVWSFDRGSYPQYNENWTFKIRWNNLPLGTLGNVKVQVCDRTFPCICSSGNRGVTFGPSPGTPIISGNTFLLNCQSQQQTYTVNSIPESWSLVSWNYSSHIQSANGTTLSPKIVSANNTTWQGMETLTGVFNFTTGGNTCATQNVNKNIWLNRPAVASQTVEGSAYYAGYQICPGNRWVGITWNGLVTSTSWTVTPGIAFYANNNECDFTLPSTGYSSVSISVNATNACGTSTNSSYYLVKKSYGCGSFLVATFPNPATEELTVKTSVQSTSEIGEYDVIADQIELTDATNAKRVSLVPTTSVIKLDTRTIPPGQYFLKLRFGNESVVKQIVIKK